MQRSSLLTTACAAILIALAHAGCSPKQEELLKEPRPSDTVGTHEKFKVPQYAGGRRLDTVLAVHFDRGGRAEYIVASMGPDSMRPAAARADLFEIYRYDSTARAFKLAFADTIRWGISYEMRDLTGDGSPELIVTTDAGGNDDVATRGMVVLSGDRGTIRTIYSVNRGAPVLTSLDEGAGAILLHSKLWPPFASHVDAVTYLDDVLAYRGGAFVSVRKEQGPRFRLLADRNLAAYGSLRRRHLIDTLRPQPDSLAVADTLAIPSDSLEIERVHPLFNGAALVMLAFGRGEQLRSLRSFWSSEEEYLRKRLPPEQFEELKKLYAWLAGM